MIGEVPILGAINAVLAIIGFAFALVCSKSLMSSWPGVLAWLIVLVTFVSLHILWIEKVMEPCIGCYKESDDPNFGSLVGLVAFFIQPLIAIAGWLIGPMWFLVGRWASAGRP